MQCAPTAAGYPLGKARRSHGVDSATGCYEQTTTFGSYVLSRVRGERLGVGSAFAPGGLGAWGHRIGTVALLGSKSERAHALNSAAVPSRDTKLSLPSASSSGPTGRVLRVPGVPREGAQRTRRSTPGGCAMQSGSCDAAPPCRNAPCRYKGISSGCAAPLYIVCRMACRVSVVVAVRGGVR